MFLATLQDMFRRSLLRQSRLQRGRPSHRPRRTRLLVEPLEDRNLLSAPVNINTDTEKASYTTPHNETSIAVNPTNPLNMIGSANDFQASFDASGNLLSVTEYSRAHVTFDGGKKWKVYEIPFDTDRYTFTGDPAVAFDADGTAYLGTLGAIPLPNGDTTNPD